MKKLNLFKMLAVLIVLITSINTALASAGYYEEGGNAIQLCFWKDGADSWQNVGATQSTINDIGTINYHLYLKKYYVYIYQDGGTGVSWNKLKYRIYKEGDTAPDFSEYSGSHIQDMGGNNKKYGCDGDMSINCFGSGVIPGESYIFEYCVQADNAGYRSNNSKNYKIRFTVAQRYLAADFNSWDNSNYPLENGKITFTGIVATTCTFKLTKSGVWTEPYGWNEANGTTDCGNKELENANDGNNNIKISKTASETNVVITYNGLQLCASAYEAFTVTVEAGSHGSVSTPSVSDIDASATSSDEITATPDVGYYFTGWTLQTGVTAADGYSESSNPIRIHASAGSKKITANFAPIWAICGSYASTASNNPAGTEGFDGWSENNSTCLIENISTSAGKTYGYKIVALEANTNYQFKMRNREEPNWYGNNTSPQYMLYTPDEKHTNWDFYTGKANCGITTAGAGNYTFTWNLTDKTLTVTYPVSYTVTFGYGTGGSEVTASGSTSGSITSGEYVASGEDVTFTQTPHDGYSFKGWYTTSDGNTAVSVMSTSDYVFDNITGNATVYAQYNPITYKITFNATTNSGSIINNGDTYEESSVRKINATYDAAVSGTMPTAQKDGYHFNGWYTASSGGNQVIAADGTWQNNVDGYTDGSGHWIKADNATLYAQYSIGISDISFSPSSVLPSEEVTITTSFTDSKNPEGNYSFCYKLTTGAGIAMQVQPTFTADGLSATFEAPGTPGSYSVEVRLYDEANHNCATEAGSIASYTSHGRTFTVEAANAVTVEYKCGNVELRPSTVVQATASQRAVSVTAPEIDGLTFTGWTRGANVTRASGDNDNVNPISIYASAASTLTANYSQRGYVYFKNTLGWEHVYLHEYNNKYYWDDTYGTGVTIYNEGAQTCTAKNIEMTLVDGTTDVYYCKPTNLPSSNTSWVFTNKTSEDQFFGSNGGNVEAVRVNDDYSSTNNMVVPEAGTYIQKNNNKAKYYTRYFFAPTLTFWGWNLRGNWDGIGESSWTNSNYWYNFTSNTFGSLEFTAKRYCDQGNFIHYIQVYTDRTAGGGIGWGKSAAVIDGLTTTPTPLNNTDGSRNITFKTTVAGEYLFVLTFGPSGDARGSLTNNIELSVIYPVIVGDSRLVYTGGTNPHPGNVIKKRANGEDVVDMYVAADQSDKIKIQSCTAVGNTSVTWGTLTNPTYAAGVDFASILSAGGPGTYSFTIVQDANGANPTITKVEKYTGPYYIRTDCVNSDKWNYMDSKEEHIMHYSDYSMTQTTEPYSHYFTKWIAGSNENQTKIRFTVATDYSESISDTLLGDAILGEGEPQVYNTNVRFMYNYETNTISRAYTQGPTDPLYMILRTPYVEESGGNHAWIYKSWASNSSYTRFSNPQTIDGVYVDTVRFDDMGNWVYQADVYARPNAPIKLTGNFSGTRYFKGTTGTTYSTTGDSPDAEKLIGGTGEPQHMRIVYDFKTNRMITSWLPPETAISGDYSLEADILLIREHQESADAITFAAGEDNKLEDVKKVYGVMKFNKATLNDPTYSRYERDLYWISFPFNVNLSDVFGFGEYGTHWIIERYDGIGRAKKGFWADSPSNWKFITPYQRDSGWVLNANEGYILALDLDELGTTSSVWDNSVSTGYLYFPSSTDIGTIKATSKTVEFLNQSEYKCNIGPRFEGGDDRRIKDSYWHCIGVPSFAGASQSISSAGIDYGSIDRPEEWTADIPFVYRWNSTNNTLSVATGSSSMTFAAMYSYLVQFSGSSLVWTGVTNTPSSVAARLAETPDKEFQLALIREDEEQDHTYVRLTDDASVSNRFEFNYDLSKEYNAGRGNIWTVTADTVEVAGNSMPKPLQTTLVPVGVKVVANGEYTLAMPEGTNGEDVYLIDNAYGTRTNLGLMPYTVTLTAGTYDSRFALEFAPIQDSPTSLENDANANANANANADVRKVFVGGRLYIIRDGKVYDAAGQRVE